MAAACPVYVSSDTPQTVNVDLCIAEWRPLQTGRTLGPFVARSLSQRSQSITTLVPRNSRDWRGAALQTVADAKLQLAFRPAR